MSEHKTGQPFYDAKITPAGKKYSVYVMKDGKRKLVHFGDSSMEQYHDKIGDWSSKDHNDAERRKNYLARAKGITNKKGEKTYKSKSSANYYSIKFLW